MNMIVMPTHLYGYTFMMAANAGDIPEQFWLQCFVNDGYAVFSAEN